MKDLDRGTKAQTVNVGEMVMYVIGIVVVFFIGAALLPEAIDVWFNVSDVSGNETSPLDSTERTLWNLAPIVVILGVILAFIVPVLVKTDKL